MSFRPWAVWIMLACAASSAGAQFYSGVVQTGNEDYGYYNNVAFSADGTRGYVTDPQNSRVIVFDPRRYDGNILAYVPTGTEPAGVYVTPDGSYACVLNVVGRNVTIIRLSDLSTRTYSPSPLPTFTYHGNIAFTPDSAYGMVCNSNVGANTVSVFRLDTGVVRSTLSVGRGPVRVYTAPRGPDGYYRAFVLCTNRNYDDPYSTATNDEISVIRLDNFTVSTFVVKDAAWDLSSPGGGICHNNIAFAPDGSAGYICDPNYNDIVSFGIPNFNDQPYVDIPAENTGKASLSRVAVTPDGSTLAVTALYSQRVYTASAKNMTLAYTFYDAEGKARFDGYNDIVTMPDNATAFVPSVGSGELVQIDLTGGGMVWFDATGPAGCQPEQVTLSPDSRFAGVVNVGGSPGQTLKDSVAIFCVSPKLINVPYLFAGPGEFTGLALSNPTAEPVTTMAYAMGRDGKAFPGAAGTPRLEVLEPYAQSAFIADQGFEIPIATAAKGWAQVYSTSSQTAALFLEASPAGDFMDGTAAGTAVLKDFTVARLLEKYGGGSYQAMTELSVVNPFTGPVVLDLTLKSASGATLATLGNQTVAAGSVLAGSLRDLFYKDSVALDVSEGYVVGRVSSGLGVSACAFTRFMNASGFTSTIRSVPVLGGSSVSTLYSPHCVSGAATGAPVPYGTSFSLVNSSAQAARVACTLRFDGSAATASGAVDIPAGGQAVFQAHTLFGLADPVSMPPLSSGTVTFVSDRAGLLGDVLFGDALNATPQFQSCLGLETGAYSRAVFSHVAAGPPPGGGMIFFNGMGIWNTGSNQITVTMKVYKTSGQVTGTKALTLPANGRLLKLIDEPDMIPAASGQMGGFIVLESAAPFIAFELFQDSGLKMLSAVPRNE